MQIIPYPDMHGKNAEEKLVKMESYLRQLADLLNYILPLLENK
jgi:hypothetical protein